MPRRGDYGELSSTARAHDMSPQSLLQQRRVRDGRCASCAAKRHRYAWFCDDCEAKNRAAGAARVQDLYDRGLCRCGEPRGAHRRCDACRERENTARRRQGSGSSAVKSR